LYRFLVGVEKLFKNVHEAEEVLLRNHVVVVEAVVAFKDKLLNSRNVFIYEFFNVLYELFLV